MDKQIATIGKYHIIFRMVILAMTLFNVSLAGFAQPSMLDPQGADEQEKIAPRGAKPPVPRPTILPPNAANPLPSLENQQALSQTGGLVADLNGQDLSVVIEGLAKISGKNVIIDPRVKGTVTFISPISKSYLQYSPEMAYQLLLSILDVHGYSAIENGSFVKVIPQANARQSATPTGGEEVVATGDAVVTQVIPLHYIDANQLVPILRPLIPQGGHMAAHQGSNVLVISDSANNVKRLLRIIKRIDIANDDDAVEPVQLQHASASEVAKVLNNLMQSLAKGQKGEKQEKSLTMVPDDRTNSLLLAGSVKDRLKVRTIIAFMDTPIESDGNTKVIYLNYAKAADLLPILDGVMKGVSKISEESHGGLSSKKNSNSFSDSGFNNTGLNNKNNENPAATAQNTKKNYNATGGGSSDGSTSIQADESTNSLVITAPTDLMQTLESIIKKLDIRRAQVLVEAIIAELSSAKARQIGVQWAFDGSQGGSSTGPVGVINFSNGQSILQISQNPYTTGEGLSLGLGSIGDDRFSLAVLTRLLQNDADTNVLSTPTLVTLDNQEAEIVVGQNVPFVTGQYTNSAISGTNTTSTTGVSPFQTIERQDIGLKLKIKPQINEGDTIKLDIEQEVSSLKSSTSGAADLITDKRYLKTTVLADNRQVVVLGGLLDDSTRASEQKVPGLGDIPVLGTLFRYKTSDNTKRNLMVFLQPVVLRNAEDSHTISLSKYQQMRDWQSVNTTAQPLSESELSLLKALEPLFRAPKAAASAK